MKLLKQIEWYFFPLRKPDLEVEALLKEVEDAKLLPKDISEPVISFVECVKNNPRRFRLKVEYSMNHRDKWYLITDKVENITWKVKVISSGYGKDVYSCDTYFTPDEKELLRGVFTEYFGNQAKMKRDLRLKRGMAKRDRLKLIYCKEVKGE